jgi:alpha,alpha-trehalose phosphorylase
MIHGSDSPIEPWAFVEEGVDLDRLAQTESLFALSNGHIGLRGNLDEGEPRGLSGTYLNGFYESFPLEYGERGYGFAEDGQTVVNVTDGKIIRLQVEDEPLDVHRGEVEHHVRRLDFRAGLLERELRWRAASGHRVQVTTKRLVSLSLRSLVAIEYVVEAVDEPVRIAIQSNLQANAADAAATDDPRRGRSIADALESQLSVDHGQRVVLGHITRRSGLSMAAGMEHVLEHDGSISSLTQSEPDLGRVTWSAELQPGKPLRLVKLLAYHWSSQQSVQWLRDQVDASLESGLAEGFDGLARAQREKLDRYWERANIEIEGDPELQQALRFAMFHLYQTAARGEGRSIAAKGLTGTGYDGHSFWDTESFVLPILSFTAPETVRAALEWRFSTLDSARERATQLHLKGAAMPWRTIHGEECSGYWPAGTAAFHVNAAVAAAVQRYVAVTGDLDFEAKMGCELLVESARLWMSLGYHDDEGDFRIDGVTGPDEYSALVDNNIYTNLMAQLNLRSAVAAVGRHAEVAERLAVYAQERDSWKVAADAMHVPYDEQLGIHPQDEHFLQHERWDFEHTPADHYPLLLHYPYLRLYSKQVVKQSDLVLAMHWRGDAFTPEQKRRNFDYYEQLCVRDSSLSACTQAVMAAEVGHLHLAKAYLYEAARMDIADLERNTGDGLHMASLAGAVIATVAGFGGLRDYGGRLSFRPQLPEGIERLGYALAVRGRLVRVDVRPEEATYTLEQGGRIHLFHWDEELSLEGGSKVTLPIPPLEDLPAPSQPPGRSPHAPPS